MIRTSTPSRFVSLTSVIAGLMTGAFVQNAHAATYQVGPGKPYPQLSAVASVVKPGDIVEVDGDATYSSVSFSKPGTAQAKITIRGVTKNGKRPIVRGGTNTIALNGSHYVIEGFDISGGSSRCVFHHADDITLRDSVVHDCPAQGILGADTGSGSLTLERVEVYRAGEGTRKHQIYVATDEDMYPNAVFRMQFCYVHDDNGGNNVKSRAGRNEIYFNWIEGAMYHELELIGSEEFAEGVLREDSDVVGNVVRKTRGSFAVRIGGDGSGETNGRYRFVNNTFVANGATKSIFRLFDGLESVEMHNNVFSGAGGSSFTLMRDSEAQWAKGHAIIGGSNNWVPSGVQTPASWMNTRSGSNPGFVNANAFDFAPQMGSALENAGNSTPMSPSEAPFPNPLGSPQFVPPSRKIEMPRMRVNAGVIDIGAIEVASMKSPVQKGFQEELQQEEPPEAEGDVETAEEELTAEGMTCSVTRNGSPTYAWAGLFGLGAVVGMVRRSKRRRG